MKSFKKILAVFLCMIFVVGCFAGCSSSGAADEITEDTMLIAYTAENAPFIYTDDEGKLTGFDVEVMKAIFDDIKNDYKNYKFIQVDADYRVGEDTAYTDSDGNNYIAYIMIGGVQRDKDSFNENYTFTENIIDNRIITVTANGSDISSYKNLKGKTVGIITEQAIEALDSNSTIKNNCKAVNEYTDLKKALNDLDSGKIDALITDEFGFNVLETKDSYNVLNGELDTISYVYSLKKYDWYVDSINEAIYELKSPDYNDADEFTPIVEKYFGYNASNFQYEPVED